MVSHETYWSTITDSEGSGQPELVQQTDYYPFGYTLRRNDFGSQHPNRRLFGSKELQDEILAGNTLDWYDFEARMYDPLIGRFMTTDPMAEKYYSITPYGYCGNNPMNAYDLHGDSISIVYNTSFLGLGKDKSVIYIDGNLYNHDGTIFTEQKCQFLSQSIDALKTISQSEEGKNMLNELQSSTNMFNIKQNNQSKFEYEDRIKAYANQILSDPELATKYMAMDIDLSGGSGGNVLWNPYGTPLHTTQGLLSNNCADLAHELFHALDSNRGLIDDKPEQGLARREWQAVYRENVLREELGFPLRTYYQTKSSLVKIVNEFNLPIHPYWY